MVDVQRNQGIPAEFQSSIIRPKGYASYNEILEITPTNTYNPLTTNEIIKFQFKTPDYLDPGEIYFDVEIESVPVDASIGRPSKTAAWYLDGTGNSLFQEIQIYSRSKHLETIRMHDQIMDFLDKNGFDPDNSQAFSFMGKCAQSQIQTNLGPTRTGTYAAIHNSQNNTSYGYGPASLGFIPTKVAPMRANFKKFAENTTSRPYYNTWQGNFDSGSATTAANPFNCSLTGLFMNQRYAYPHVPIANGTQALTYAQTMSTTGTTAGTVNYDGQVVHMKAYTGHRCELSEAFDGSGGCQATNKTLPVLNEDETGIGPYTDVSQDNAVDFTTDTDLVNKPFLWANKTHNAGYLSYWSEGLATGGQRKRLETGGFPKCWIANGQFQTVPVKSNKMRLQIPLNSGVLGTLLPEYKMIPGIALGDCEIQIRINPYAFYASGLGMSADTADDGMGTTINLGAYQIPRQWKMSSIKLVMQTYSFDEAFTRQLEAQLDRGITLRSNGFDFAQATSVADSRFLQGSWPIITGIQSAKAIYVFFQLEDYMKYTYCSKYFNVSGNVTSIQLKMNSDYYPRRPIQGHAGNPVINDLSNGTDNTEFLVWYQRQFGIFNKLGSYCAVNQLNFAINERSYDPDWSKSTHLNSSGQQIGYKDYLLYGIPGQEEQRVQGKAIYPFSFVQKPNAPDTLQGINLADFRPLEVLIKTDQINYCPRSVGMFILIHFNIEIQMNKNGIQVFGYG